MKFFDTVQGREADAMTIPYGRTPQPVAIRSLTLQRLPCKTYLISQLTFEV